MKPVTPLPLTAKNPGGDRSRERWLKRLRRELAESGAVAQMALQLARQDGLDPSSWETRLRNIFLGTLPPDPETIFRIETLLARPAPGPTAETSAAEQGLLHLP